MMNSRPWYEVDNVDDISSPGLLLYPERIRENLKRMVAWAGADRLRPHVKTHKLPQVVQMKLEAGITKFKTSTIAEAEMTAAAGGKDILLALQPVGPMRQRFLDLIEAFPETTFSVIIDDATNAQELSLLAQSRGVCVNVLVDLDIGMHRTGIGRAGAAELCRFISQSAGLRLLGLHAYDGHIHDVDEALVQQQAEQAFAPVWQLRSALEEQGIEIECVVGCGTPTSKMMVGRHDIEVSAGTSVLWDAGQPGINPPLEIECAAVLIARVISRPTDQDLCLDLGHKSVASEMAHPRVRFFALPDAETVMHNEEHLVMRTPDADRFPVGSVLYGVPTHICPTIALHQEVWAVRDRLAIEAWPVVARARRITI